MSKNHWQIYLPAIQIEQKYYFKKSVTTLKSSLSKIRLHDLKLNLTIYRKSKMKKILLSLCASLLIPALAHANDAYFAIKNNTGSDITMSFYNLGGEGSPQGIAVQENDGQYYSSGTVTIAAGSYVQVHGYTVGTATIGKAGTLNMCFNSSSGQCDDVNNLVSIYLSQPNELVKVNNDGSNNLDLQTPGGGNFVWIGSAATANKIQSDSMEIVVKHING